MERGTDAPTGHLAIAGVPLSTVFGFSEGGETYWTIVLAVAFLIVALVLFNQIASGTLVLKE